ncbi:hypothetical protein MUK42_31661 [Musa troglodytarum]|uniref:Uncharacterized protein n=1 Tax=Musa troglodytarum TaxID=320322 RepID=A0A9E7IB16_9LILI|nr:hypothetical protein MUK42_31661 [Musa troglodytarum]
MTLLFGFLFYKENGETMNRIHVMRLPPCPNTTKKKQQRQYTGGGSCSDSFPFTERNKSDRKLCDVDRTPVAV